MASSLPLLVLLLCALNVAHSKITIYDLRAIDLPSDALSKADGFVEIFYNSVAVGKTSVKSNTKDPWWSESYTHSAQVGGTLRFEVYDEDVSQDDLLGQCAVEVVEGTHPESCALAKGGTFRYIYKLE